MRTVLCEVARVITDETALSMAASLTLISDILDASENPVDCQSLAVGLSEFYGVGVTQCLEIITTVLRVVLDDAA